MFEYHDSIDTVNLISTFSETEVPDPVEHWSLDDFEDLLPNILIG